MSFNKIEPYESIPPFLENRKVEALGDSAKTENEDEELTEEELTKKRKGENALEKKKKKPVRDPFGEKGNSIDVQV